MIGMADQAVLMIAAAVGAAMLLVVATLFGRDGAFSRHVDQRRVRRAKFQDEWTDLITSSDQRAVA